MAPDADVLGFRFGIHYGDFLGHRGFTHSLAFAALVALVVVSMRGSVAHRRALWLYLFVATASHGLLDAFTDGGLGVALLAPFDNTRYFFPVRPILVSPIGISSFFSQYGLSVITSEASWVWLPSAILATTGWLIRSRHAGRALLAVVIGLSCTSLAHAQTDVLIDIDRGRTTGLFKKSPVLQRAILARPATPSDTALLYFRGYPGIARIESVADKSANLQPFMRINQRMFADEGIGLVVVDCPTDQWGGPGPSVTSCLDGYRSSKEHADDVRSVIAKLRDEYGFSKIFVMGHSFGTISSRWLAKNLGSEINGSIHSASMNGSNRLGYANSLSGFAYDAIAAPMLHVHNENDACPSTPYAAVKAYARDNLVTVRGGVPSGDPCGGTHLHSYQGREDVVVRAIISWIKTGKVDRLVGE